MLRWLSWMISMKTHLGTGSVVVQSCPTLCNPMDCSIPGFLSFTISWSLLKLTSNKSLMPSNHLVLCCPLLLPSIFPSIRVFSNELALIIRWPKYWTFSLSTSPSKEYSGLFSFRMDWFELLVVQGTLKSLPQHHSWKVSILQSSVFFMAQLTSIMTTGKTIALTRWIFISKMMSLLFNMLSRFVLAFLPMSECLLIFSCSHCSNFGALCNSMKLWAMLWRATLDGQAMMESFDNTCSTEKGNGKPLKHSCIENPMNHMWRQKNEELK